MSSTTYEYVSFELPVVNIDPDPPKFARSGHFPNDEFLTLADDGQPCETASRRSFQLPPHPGNPGSTLEDHKESLTRALRYYAASAHRWPRQIQRRWLELAQRPGYCHMLGNQPWVHKFYKAAKLTENDEIPNDAVHVPSYDTLAHIPVRYFRAEMCDTGAYVFARGLFGCPTRFQYYWQAVKIAGNLPNFSITASDEVYTPSSSDSADPLLNQVVEVNGPSNASQKSTSRASEAHQNVLKRLGTQLVQAHTGIAADCIRPVVDLSNTVENSPTWLASEEPLRRGLESIATNARLGLRDAFDTCVKEVTNMLVTFARTHFDLEVSDEGCRRLALDAAKEITGARISDEKWSGFWHTLQIRCFSHQRSHLVQQKYILLQRDIRTGMMLSEGLTTLESLRRDYDLPLECGESSFGDRQDWFK